MNNLFETHVEKELKSMDQRLSDLEEKMNSIDTKLTQVVDAILGNSLTKAGGFLKDMEDLKNKIEVLEAQIEKQEEFKKRFSWTVGIMTVLAFLIQYIVNIYTKIKQ